MNSILYIHGAGASILSFKWLNSKFCNRHTMYFEYDVKESLSSCIDRLNNSIENLSSPCFIISHSLGGLIAAGVAHNKNIAGIVTMCTPFGGLAVATMMSVIKNDQIFRDLSPLNPQLRILRNNIKKCKNHLAIIANSGLPFSFQENDGAVTVESQTSINGISYTNVNLNHFEVLLSEEIASLIQNFIYNIEHEKGNLK